MPAPISESIVLAFTEAGAKLGFGFEPHFAVFLPGGTAIRTLGLVREFGSPAGTVLFCEECEPSPQDAATLKAMGYFWSVLFPSYAQFVESHFVATLSDWGYFGSQSDPPKWYTGEPWSR